MTDMRKPPLGAIPTKLVLEQQYRDLKEAEERYNNHLVELKKEFKENNAWRDYIKHVYKVKSNFRVEAFFIKILIDNLIRLQKEECV